MAVTMAPKKDQKRWKSLSGHTDSYVYVKGDFSVCELAYIQIWIYKVSVTGFGDR